MDSKTMKLIKNKGVKYINFNIYKEFSNLIAVHSTRIGGISEGVFKSMNLGFTRGDKKEYVLENYELFADAINVDVNKMVLSDQWHHTNILKVDESHLGMGIRRKRKYSDIDGLVTDLKDIPLVTFYADCVPIYFYDSKKQVIGMAHSGWRGTVSGISKEMIKIFIRDYKSSLDDIVVAIGPAICKSCYEVGYEVIEGLSELTFNIEEFYTYNKKRDRYYIDLWNINKSMLINLGIKENNISVSDMCTKCNPDLFFSHRGHGNDRGTQIGVMMLKGEKDG